MMNTATNKIVKRDGRNSAKRLNAARLEILCHADKVHRLRAYAAESNAYDVIKLLELATDKNVETDFRIRSSDRVTTFLDISLEELAKPEFKLKIRAWYELVWDSMNLDKHSHKKCKAYALENLRMPIYSNLKTSQYAAYNGCICCGRKLGCEHNRIVSLSQAECRDQGIYHAGRCYHVSKCLDCGDIQAVDSSD